MLRLLEDTFDSASFGYQRSLIAILYETVDRWPPANWVADCRRLALDYD